MVKAAIEQPVFSSHFQDNTGCKQERVYATVLEGVCHWTHCKISEKKSLLIIIILCRKQTTKKPPNLSSITLDKKTNIHPLPQLPSTQSLCVELHTV